MGTADRKRRIANSLWGLFAGDALAMPAHWYYSVDNIKKDFDGGVRGYVAPPHPHPESFMVGMSYQPDVEAAQRLDRPYDILHEHVRFYQTPYSNLEIDRSERESEHGNATPKLEDRYHYHHGLKAGDNTVAANLARVLLRSVAKAGRYDPDAFLEGFVEYLTTPGLNRDAYTEIYIRRWFENYTRGWPLHACAEEQRNVWSIGSHGGMMRAMVVAHLAGSAYQGLGFAIEHQNLTHRSENVASALGVVVPLLHELVAGEAPADALARAARFVHTPRVTGEELFASYRAHKGPGNIPHDEMWKLHTDLVENPFDVVGMARDHDEAEVVRHRFANACYTEHGLPLSLYFAQAHGLDVEATLLASANAGGDNGHRGAVLGLLVGAAHEEFPDHLRDGLRDADAIAAEINAFVDVAVSGAGL